LINVLMRLWEKATIMLCPILGRCNQWYGSLASNLTDLATSCNSMTPFCFSSWMDAVTSPSLLVGEDMSPLLLDNKLVHFSSPSLKLCSITIQETSFQIMTNLFVQPRASSAVDICTNSSLCGVSHLGPLISAWFFQLLLQTNPLLHCWHPGQCW
jgi:hypothetical protein